MKIRKKFFDFEYSEVLDMKTKELIRVACAVAKEQGASDEELNEAMAYGMMAPGGRAKNFTQAMLKQLKEE